MNRTLLLLACAVVAQPTTRTVSCQSTSGLRFELAFPNATGPRTGRAYVAVARDGTPEPRLQAGELARSTPFFGTDVRALAPGQTVIVDANAAGYPLRSLASLPAGDYWVQAVFNVYTEFHRADGRTLWLHQDQWEGQKWNESPGNLVSEPQRIHLDPHRTQTVRLTLSRTLPPIALPPDTKWVKHVKIQSRLLTAFWGHPMYLGATVLLPAGYDEHADQHYAVIYEQGHFTLSPPFGFDPNGTPETAEHAARRRMNTEREPGYEFARAWMSDSFPRVIAITFQHPTPYYDDSYAINSVNDGPYGDAIVQELIPYLEKQFRIVAKPYARILIGGSTGGWEALALQIYHPDFFGGAWGLYPDPVDFRRYQLSNIYEDTSAFAIARSPWLASEVPAERESSGMPTITMRQESQLEDALGTHGRSGEQLEAWEAVWGPTDADGYPAALWDKRTGHMNRQVADYMRDHGYDLRAYLQNHWSTVGPELQGKLHVVVGEMDSYYLNLACYLLQDFLDSTTAPHSDATFTYGRPLKPHGWQPWTDAAFVRMAFDTISAHASADAGR
ncbi:MAG TPA: alpha/beta hydrolase-fold protein [Gemmatimonadaceae bacterium]|nr:alpha/beta hydrolase-fold protein [Gemmatimonadaceae bacterium]